MTERHYPWDVLDIDETDNKKLIKKAYAVLIKQHKPDEHPEKFQEIQEAYKCVLQNINSSTIENPNASSKFIESRIDKKTKKISSKAIKDLAVDDEDGFDIFDEADNRIYKTIVNKAKQLMGEELITRTNIETWKFIDEYHNLNNLKLKKIVAEEVFKICSERNVEFFKRNKQLKLTNTIMAYLYDTFDWNSKWNDYSSVFNEDAMAIMTSYQESDSKDIINSLEEVNIKNRFKIFRLEFAISYIIATVFFFILDLSLLELIKLVIYIILFVRVGFEILFKTTIIKLGANIYTTDSEGNNCTRFKFLIKHIVLALLFLPIYNLIFSLNIHYYVWIFIFSLLIVLNTLAIIIKSKFLHDIITNTIVVEKKGIFEDQ